MHYTLTELQIELAGICNVACVYCTWRERQTGKQLMDKALAHWLTQQAIRLIPRPLVTFHGVGEATLHPECLQLLEHADEAGLPVRLSTNCTTLDNKWIERLKNLKNLGLSLALHQGLPRKTKEKCSANAQDFLAASPHCRSVEVLLVCDGTGAPAAEKIIDTFLPLVERIPQARLNLKQPQTWPKSPPIKGHIPADPRHPQVFVDKVQTPCSLGRGCRMPEYLMSIQADGTVTLCCVGEEDWHLPTIHGREIKELWDSQQVRMVRELWAAKSDTLPCGHCLKREDC